MDKSCILITGGAGFIGSNFINYIMKKNDKVNILNIDKLTYAGNLTNLESLENNKRYMFVKGDISDRKLINRIFTQYKIGGVINFAAESHVDRSILNPEMFIKTNITGTHVLLEAAKKYGVRNFIQASSDEVYGSVLKGKSDEKHALMPNSPYSASKASADLVCRSYFKTYGVPVIITRSSNNYGPYQFPEKLIPLMINNIIEGKHLPVYADGKNERDWIYVEDNCRAIYDVLQKGKAGEIYNIGGGVTESNINIVNNICGIMSKKTGKSIDGIKALVKHVKDRPGHDFRYCLDNSKIQNETKQLKSLKGKDLSKEVI